MVAPFLFPFRPSLALRMAGPGLRWAAAILVPLCAGTFLYWAGHDRVVGELLSSLPLSADAADRAAAAAWAEADFARRLAFHPFRLAGGWLLFAVVLRLSLILFRPARTPGFRETFLLVLLAEGILILGGWADLLLGGALPRLADLLQVSGIGGRATLEGVTPFSLWYIAALASAGAGMCGTSGWRSLGAVLLAWGLAAAGNAAVLVTIAGRFHFPL